MHNRTIETKTFKVSLSVILWKYNWMSSNWRILILKHPLLKCFSCSVSFLRNKNARVDFANNCSVHHFVAAAAGGGMDCRRACACSREVGHPQCRLSRCCTVTGAVTLVPARHWPALGQSQVSPASPASPLTAPPVHPRTPEVTPQRYHSKYSESKLVDFSTWSLPRPLRSKARITNIAFWRNSAEIINKDPNYGDGLLQSGT